MSVKALEDREAVVVCEDGEDQMEADGSCS